MNKKRQLKLIGIMCLVLLLSVATGLVLYALKQNINLFYTPNQLLTLKFNPAEHMRVGGYVKKNSVHYDASGKNVSFVLMDTQNSIGVNYGGVLPSLFREGQGVVVSGQLVDAHTLLASEVLAKHDEKYVPRYMVQEGSSSPRRRGSP